MSTNEKKKESGVTDDSNSIPEDVLQALADATAEDEAEFLDALSEDVDEEMHEKETIIESASDFKAESSNSTAFPELNINQADEVEEDKESPFDLSSPFDSSEGQAEEQQNAATHEIEDLQVFDDSEDTKGGGSPQEDISEDLLSEESDAELEQKAQDDVENDFLSHDEGSDILSQEELENLSDMSADLDEAIAQADFSADEPSAVSPAPEKDSEPAPVAQAISEDQTEMLQEEDYPTMAVGQAQSSEAQSPNPGRNPLIDLKNADYIKFAQDKIKSLEKQLFDLRAECEELARAGDHFKNLADESGQKVKTLEAKVEELESLSTEEKKILQESISSKELRINTMQEHIENLEQELESRYNRVRVRERDLEGRLEILKKEQSAVAKSKDEMILKLKSQNESLKSDLEKVRAQSQKVTSHLQDKEDALRRTMKALKLSLTMLESQSKD